MACTMRIVIPHLIMIAACMVVNPLQRMEYSARTLLVLHFNQTIFGGFNGSTLTLMEFCVSATSGA